MIMDINLLLNFLWQSWVTEMIWKKRDVGFNLRVQFAQIKVHIIIIRLLFLNQFTCCKFTNICRPFQKHIPVKKRESEGERMDEY